MELSLNPTDVIGRIHRASRLTSPVLVVFDGAIVVTMTVAAYYARFDGTVPSFFGRWIPHLSVASVVVYLTLFGLFGLYRIVLRHVGLEVLLRLLAACAIGFALLLGVNLLMPMEDLMRPVPLGVLFIQGVLVFVGAAGARVAVRVVLHLHAVNPGDRQRALIVGAGSVGPLLLREIRAHPDLELAVVGFLDDDTALHGRTINGVRVLGGTADLGKIVDETGAQEVIVAMPSAPRETVRSILNAAADAGVRTRVVPQLLADRGSVSLRDLRPIEVEDLLGRELTPIDVEQIRSTIKDHVVLVTGAAGSIGSELCRQVAKLEPAALVLLDIDESRLYELWLELEGSVPGLARMAICDIRDAGAVTAVFDCERPQVVLHSAAYKHVPLMELSPAEAVKTNVLGTRQIIEACERHGVERFVLISTDKAVSPVNVMGLTKSLAERVTLAAVRRGKINAVAVRFGNVLASRGSVVPIFEKQLRHGGPLTVTDPEVTRYFMMIPEASRLVLQAQAIGKPGDIFVLEMGEPVKIVELARKMIALAGVPAEIVYTGLRPGERLHEELITRTERLLPTDCEKILRVDRVKVPEPTLEDDLADLIARAAEGDRGGLFAAVERLEPGFAERNRGPEDG